MDFTYLWRSISCFLNATWQERGRQFGFIKIIGETKNVISGDKSDGVSLPAHISWFNRCVSMLLELHVGRWWMALCAPYKWYGNASPIACDGINFENVMEIKRKRLDKPNHQLIRYFIACTKMSECISFRVVGEMKCARTENKCSVLHRRVARQFGTYIECVVIKKINKLFW